MKKRTKVLAGAAMAAAAGTAAVLAGARYAYREAFEADPKRQAPPEEIPEGEQFDRYREEMLCNIRRTAAVEYERVTVESHDGLTLAGKYYAGEDGVPLMIFFHGYRSTPERDASGGLHFCRDRGWHVLLAAQRAHGESGGKTITFGIRERYDCLTWIESMLERLGKETPIFLWGISMGATTVLMASGNNLPQNVIGVLADCGFSCAKDIICKVIRQMKLPDKLLYPFVRLGALLFGGFDPNNADATAALRRCSLPVIFFHGDTDDYVPCEMSRINYDACSGIKELVVIPNAGHGLCYPADPKGYVEKLKAVEKHWGL